MKIGLASRKPAITLSTEQYGSWENVYSCFRKWIEDGIENEDSGMYVLYEAYRKCYLESWKIPDKQMEDMILDCVFHKIDDAGIWIPDGEIYRYYHSRKNKLSKRLKKEFAIV